MYNRPSATKIQINSHWNDRRTHIWTILATMHIGVNVSIENMPRMNDTKQTTKHNSLNLF